MNRRIIQKLHAWFIAGISFATLFVLIGCVSVPAQEMSDARQAFMAAQQVGAEDKAPMTLHEAGRMLRSAEKALSKKLYSVARQDALRAKELAMQARRAAVEETTP